MLSNKIALPAGWLILSGRFRGNRVSTRIEYKIIMIKTVNKVEWYGQ